VTGGMLTGNTFLVRLERRKRIWWLQILFLPRFRKLTTPQASSKSLSCIWGATLRRRKRREKGRRKRKGKNGWIDGI